jgi:hypothetical protein
MFDGQGTVRAVEESEELDGDIRIAASLLSELTAEARNMVSRQERTGFNM